MIKIVSIANKSICMKRMIMTTALCTLCALLTSGCATIFTGTSDTIYFDSNPRGAKVIIDGVEICTTPCHGEVDRSTSDMQAIFALDGYKPQVITLDRKFNVISVLNLTSFIGWGIDLLTGAIYEYKYRYYNIDLENNKGVRLTGVQEIRIDTVNKEVAITKFAQR